MPPVRHGISPMLIYQSLWPSRLARLEDGGKETVQIGVIQQV